MGNRSRTEIVAMILDAANGGETKTKIKNSEDDPDKRWITTWNDYLLIIYNSLNLTIL